MACRQCVFGFVWRDLGVPVPAAAAAALAVGCVGGSVNAALISRLSFRR